MELPDDFFGGIEFDDLVAIAAGDEEISIGERDDFVGVAGDFDGAEEGARGIEFDDFAFAFEADEIVTCGSFSGTAELVMEGDGGIGGEFNFFGDLAGAIDFYEATGATFDDQDRAIGEGLAAVDFGMGWRLVGPSDDFFGGDFFGAVEFGEEIIAIGKKPAVLGIFGGKLPSDDAFGGDGGDLVAVVVGAKERVGGGGEGDGGEEGGEEAKGGRGWHGARVGKGWRGV